MYPRLVMWPAEMNKREIGGEIGMKTDQFKILHSEIMMYFQCIEFDLKRIYSGMSSEDFDDEMDMLEVSNFGNTLRKLKQLDESDGDPWLSEADYEQLDRIREIRNYWAHQCYLDYIYINNGWQRESKFQRIANRLSNEHNRIYNLHHKLQDLYFDWFED